MNKKSIGALLLSAALLVGATGGTFAYFTETKNTANQTIQFGDLHIAFTPASGDAAWTVHRQPVTTASEAFLIDPNTPLSDYDKQGYDELVIGQNSVKNIAPGDTMIKGFTLKNTGKIDAKVSFSLAGFTLDGETVDLSKVVNEHNVHFRAYSFDVDNNKPGKEIALNVSTRPGGKDLNYILDAKTNETVVVYAYLWIDPKTGNDAMDKQIQFTVQADATQWNNPGWDVNGN